MSKEDWDVLVASKHSTNFEVLNAEDFTPPEAQTAPAPAEKENSTPSAKSGKKEGDK